MEPNHNLDVLKAALEYLSLDSRGMSLTEFFVLQRKWKAEYKGDLQAVIVMVEEAHRGNSLANAKHYIRVLIERHPAS